MLLFSKTFLHDFRVDPPRFSRRTQAFLHAFCTRRARNRRIFLKNARMFQRKTCVTSFSSTARTWKHLELLLRRSATLLCVERRRSTRIFACVLRAPRAKSVKILQKTRACFNGKRARLLLRAPRARGNIWHDSLVDAPRFSCRTPAKRAFLLCVLRASRAKSTKKLHACAHVSAQNVRDFAFELRTKEKEKIGTTSASIRLLSP